MSHAGPCPARPLREEPCPTQGTRRAPLRAGEVGDLRSSKREARPQEIEIEFQTLGSICIFHQRGVPRRRNVMQLPERKGDLAGPSPASSAGRARRATQGGGDQPGVCPQEAWAAGDCQGRR